MAREGLGEELIETLKELWDRTGKGWYLQRSFLQVSSNTSIQNLSINEVPSPCPFHFLEFVPDFSSFLVPTHFKDHLRCYLQVFFMFLPQLTVCPSNSFYDVCPSFAIVSQTFFPHFQDPSKPLKRNIKAFPPFLWNSKLRLLTESRNNDCPALLRILPSKCDHC